MTPTSPPPRPGALTLSRTVPGLALRHEPGSAGHEIASPLRSRAAQAASQVRAALSFLELVDRDDAATQALRAHFERACTSRHDAADWEALSEAATQLVEAWNPYLRGQDSDPYAAALFASLSHRR